MKYHVVSTSKTGHGAVFTNLKDAKEYMKQHSGSTYTVFDRMPIKIPPIKTADEIPAPSKPVQDTPLSGITVFTDGSALGNPGPGGYGVVIIEDGSTMELSQGFRHTTNNRMEMMGVITALEKLAITDQPIKIFSDSQYTLNGITKGWAKSWRKKGWKKSDGKPAKNSDLWEQILNLVDQFPRLTFQWVRGHAGNHWNEKADDLANGAAQKKDLIEDIGYNK